MFGAMRVNVVEPGTVVGKSRDGEGMVVRDDNIVLNGGEMWVTQKTYDKLKETT